MLAGEGAEAAAEHKQAVAAEAAVVPAQAMPAEPAEKTAAELEEENYKEMQNFEEYAKTKGKPSKLTLADLMGGGGSGDGNAEGEGEAGGEEGEAENGEEEYYEEGEYCEGEDGEYHEEEAAPPPEVRLPCAVRILALPLVVPVGPCLPSIHVVAFRCVVVWLDCSQYNAA